METFCAQAGFRALFGCGRTRVRRMPAPLRSSGDYAFSLGAMYRGQFSRMPAVTEDSASARALLMGKISGLHLQVSKYTGCMAAGSSSMLRRGSCRLPRRWSRSARASSCQQRRIQKQGLCQIQRRMRTKQRVATILGVINELFCKICALAAWGTLAVAFLTAGGLT